jgi:hypothetical protein
MGRPKLSPDVVKLGARYPAGVLENPKPIAQRFAHAADLPQAPLRPADSPTASPPAQPPRASLRGAIASVAGRLAVRTRLLMVGLTLAAVVPNLVLLALWLGLIGSHGSEPAMREPAPPAAAPSAVLTAPARIEAIAGEGISFPIALDGTDGVPPRSVVAIRGLPHGSKLSEGRPYGDNEWNLTPDQIGDLALVAPGDANGEFKLGLALIAPDNKVIAEAETLLGIAPAPAPAEPPAPVASGVLSSDGGEGVASAALLDTGDGAELEEKPATMEAATAPTGEALPEGGEQAMEEETAPSGDAPPGKFEQTREAATAPSGDAPPAMVGQPEDTGLGTVQPSVFVNLREGPSSSSSVVAVVAKGAKLSVLDRKRGWVQVTDPETAKKGWIYSGNLAGETKTYRRRKRAAPAEAEPKSESFWGRVGRWLSPG